MADGLRERYEWKGFKIYFGKKDDYMYGSVIAGATVLKSCRHESLEKVKKEVRFLKDSNNIRDVIKEIIVGNSYIVQDDELSRDIQSGKKRDQVQQGHSLQLWARLIFV